MEPSKEDNIKSTFEKIKQSYEKVNILVNNAARFIFKSIDGNTYEKYDDGTPILVDEFINLYK